MNNQQSPFEASAAALGYAYQFRYALLQALEHMKYGLNWKIAIEAADDVEISGEDGSELQQLKLRQEGTILGDSDPDLWKTIRIWADGYYKKQIDPTSTRFYLVTTAKVKTDTIGSLLGADEARDIAKAREKLDAVSLRSINRTNKEAYKAYRLLSSSQKDALLQSVYISPKSEDIEKVRINLRHAIRIGLREHQIEPVLQRLEGWWFQQCIECMMKKRTGIHAADIEGFIADLRDRFGPDNLPIDQDILRGAAPDLAEFSGRIFYHQLMLTEVAMTRVQFAVRDYLRAVTQRTSWSRIGVLLPGELEDYELKLTEEWLVMFERMKEELGPNAAEEEKIRIAKRIYAWAEDANVAPIREKCTEAFLARGTYQILSDNQTVGWHPEYTARLIALLEPASIVDA